MERIKESAAPTVRQEKCLAITGSVPRAKARFSVVNIYKVIIVEDADLILVATQFFNIK